MSTSDMGETLKYLLERYGLPTLVACAAMFSLRHDVLLPLVEQHSQFLKTISESQKEIADAVKEQTRLLYALQPRSSSKDGENQRGAE